MAPVDEDDGNNGQPIDYRYTEDELNATSANLSIRQQMVSLHCSSKLIMTSVATVMTDVFQKNEINLLRKFGKIVRIFDKVDDSKNRGVI